MYMCTICRPSLSLYIYIHIYTRYVCMCVCLCVCLFVRMFVGVCECIYFFNSGDLLTVILCMY